MAMVSCFPEFPCMYQTTKTRTRSCINSALVIAKHTLRLKYQCSSICITVKILKIGTPEIITILVLHLEQLDFTVQYCVQKMQTE